MTVRTYSYQESAAAGIALIWDNKNDEDWYPDIME